MSRTLYHRLAFWLVILTSWGACTFGSPPPVRPWIPEAPPPAAPADEVRVVPVIVVADEEFRRSSHWRRQVEELLAGASQSYAPYGLSFQAVSFGEWQAPAGHFTVPELLGALRDSVPAPRGHLVLGLTGREFLFSATIDHIGMAYFLGNHALLRSVKTPEDYERFRARYPSLSKDALEEAYRADVARRTRLVLEHELGHIFGAIHVNDRSSIMYPSLTTRAQGFDSFNREVLLANANRHLGEEQPLTGEALSRALALYQTGCDICVTEEATRAAEALKEASRVVQEESSRSGCPSPGSEPSWFFADASSLQPQQLLSRAKCRYAAGEPEEARADLEALLQKDPSHKQANLLLSDLLVALGKPEEAVALLERIRLRQDPELLASLGEAYVRVKNFEAAEAVLIQSLALKPESVWPRLVLTITYMEQKDYQAAVSLLAPWVEKEGFPYDARYYLGLCYIALQKDKLAEEELTAYLMSAQADTARASDKGHAQRQVEAARYLGRLKGK